jgi:hypothetical protein
VDNTSIKTTSAKVAERETAGWRLRRLTLG